MSITNATNAHNARTLRSFGPNGVNHTHDDYKRTGNLNQVAQQIEMDTIMQLYCGRFKWKGDLPNVNLIEQMLYYNGVVALFEHKTLGLMCLPCTIINYNVYGLPNEIRIAPSLGFSTNGFPLTLEYGQYRLIWANESHYKPIDVCRYYSTLIADLARACKVYSDGMKKPIILKGEFEKVKSLEKLIVDRMNNESFVIVDTNLIGGDEKDVEISFSTHNGTDLKALYMHKQDLYSEMLRKMGIQANSMNKGAQLTEDEVNKFDFMSDIILASDYACREQRNEQIAEFAAEGLTCTPLIPLPSLKPNEGQDNENQND